MTSKLVCCNTPVTCLVLHSTQVTWFITYALDVSNLTYYAHRCCIQRNEVGDEFHYLLNYSNENVKRNRTKYVDKYYTHHPKFCSLMNMTSKSKNIKLAKFISCILELF